MPCYEPPRPDRHDYDEMMRQRDKHIATLKDIEAECRRWIPADTMTGIPAEMLAKKIMDIIDKHWEQKASLQPQGDRKEQS